jgi:hypothetical protein
MALFGLERIVLSFSCANASRAKTGIGMVEPRLSFPKQPRVQPYELLRPSTNLAEKHTVLRVSTDRQKYRL